MKDNKPIPELTLFSPGSTYKSPYSQSRNANAMFLKFNKPFTQSRTPLQKEGSPQGMMPSNFLSPSLSTFDLMI